MMNPIFLTVRQADQVRWALDPMDDFWCSADGAESRDGKEYPDKDLPRLVETGTKAKPYQLILSPVEEINSDLLYRLEVQLQDMAASEADPQAKGDACTALNAAALIRKADPKLAELPEGGGWC